MYRVYTFEELKKEADLNDPTTHEWAEFVKFLEHNLFDDIYGVKNPIYLFDTNLCGCESPKMPLSEKEVYYVDVIDNRIFTTRGKAFQGADGRYFCSPDAMRDYIGIPESECDDL